jgi:hypothetical protein
MTVRVVVGMPKQLTQALVTPAVPALERTLTQSTEEAWRLAMVIGEVMLEALVTVLLERPVAAQTLLVEVLGRRQLKLQSEKRMVGLRRYCSGDGADVDSARSRDGGIGVGRGARLDVSGIFGSSFTPGCTYKLSVTVMVLLWVSTIPLFANSVGWSCSRGDSSGQRRRPKDGGGACGRSNRRISKGAR